MNFMERNPELRALLEEFNVKPQAVHLIWEVEIERKFFELAKELPDGHVWKEGKLEHALRCRDEVWEHAKLLGLRDIEVDILGFLLFAHDIGRMVEAGRAVKGEPRVSWEHGTDSVNVIKNTFTLLGLNGHFGVDFQSLLWQAMLSAIEHHSDVRMPTLEVLNNDRAVLAIVGFLRDMDKKGNFEYGKAVRYTHDEEHKQKQREANWPEERKIDLTWGEEKNRIDPADLIDSFEKFQQLPRRECASYEAYMLQYLSWLFDVQNPEILNLIMLEGGPWVVLDYLTRQLYETEREQWARITRIVIEFLSQMSLKSRT